MKHGALYRRGKSTGAADGCMKQHHRWEMRVLVCPRVTCCAWVSEMALHFYFLCVSLLMFFRKAWRRLTGFILVLAIRGLAAKLHGMGGDLWTDVMPCVASVHLSGTVSAAVCSHVCLCPRLAYSICGIFRRDFSARSGKDAVLCQGQWILSRNRYWCESTALTKTQIPLNSMSM